MEKIIKLDLIRQDITTLNIHFTNEEFLSGKSEQFSEKIVFFIGLSNARTSLFLSTKVKDSGISFFLFTKDFELAKQFNKEFSMRFYEEGFIYEELLVVYGNATLFNCFEELI